MSRPIGGVSHHERELAELRADRELAVEYLKAAMESLDDPDDRAAGLLALRTVAEAYGGLGAVAAEAGIKLSGTSVCATQSSPALAAALRRLAKDPPSGEHHEQPWGVRHSVGLAGHDD